MKNSCARDWLIDSSIVMVLAGIAVFVLTLFSALFAALSLHLGPVAAIGKFIEILNIAGRIGLSVDAKDRDANCYYEQFGFVCMPSNELELSLPIRTIREAPSKRRQPLRV